MAERCDVVIMGGGLAGLTLALQLRQRFPSLEVTVLERARHPVPATTHKVGESLVEIGAHYLDTVLGLEAHLNDRQLRKFGFRFFLSDGRLDVDQVSEVGITRHFPVRTYQIDRGLFENFLAEQVRESGARFLDGAIVRGFTIASPSSDAEREGACGHEAVHGHGGREREAARGREHEGTWGHAGTHERALGDEHEVVYERAGAEGSAEQRIRARWLVDASGRAGLIKRRLELDEPNEHRAHSVWFRVGAPIDVDDWSEDRGWLARCTARHRRLSTSHLVGDGYWVWLIPLACGSHSIGIVADPRTHAPGSMNTFERAMQWLGRHQPRLAQELETRRDKLQDFKSLRRFSYGCKQVFSGSRWAMTGEAGVFLDPLYSPGSDFIAIANTYITELIARDLAGEPVEPYARLFGQLYLSFYRSTLSLYLDQYAIFGDPEVLPWKVYWDYSYYWGVLCQLFFHGRLTDMSMMGSLRGELAATYELNQSMQPFLRAWSRISAKRNGASLTDQNALDWFVELNRGLEDRLDDAAFKSRMRENSALLHGLAEAIVTRATGEHPGLDAAALRALIESRRRRDGTLPSVPLCPQER